MKLESVRKKLTGSPGLLEAALFKVVRTEETGEVPILRCLQLPPVGVPPARLNKYKNRRKNPPKITDTIIVSSST